MIEGILDASVLNVRRGGRNHRIGSNSSLGWSDRSTRRDAACGTHHCCSDFTHLRRSRFSGGLGIGVSKVKGGAKMVKS